ncbi:dephospho-CoA kinase [bacterium]|nr:dephospho-CoA kinase [bacterium]
MIKVAITGNIASGKSAVEDVIKSQGFKTLCADKIVADLYKNKEILSQLKNTFGTLEKKEIAQIVFNDKEKKLELERIIHPYVKNEIEKFILNNSSEKAVFVSVPLLFEAGFENLFDKIIFVTADENIRLERVMKRDNCDKNFAKKKILAQAPENDKIEKSDYIIENNSTIEELENQVKTILQTF